MTFAWYGHLKHFNQRSIFLAILVSWLVAFFEYCLQVPANRIGYQSFTLPQLKIMQEVITLLVFVGFAWGYMGVRLTLDFVWASLCMMGAVYFIFRQKIP